MLDMFFYLYRKELIIIGGGSLFLITTCLFIFFFSRRWLTKYSIQKNIRKIEFYMAGGDKSPDLCCELGNNYLDINDYAHAEYWFKEALDADADNMEAYLSLAELYKKSQDYKKLRDIYYRLAELNPYDYDILRELGWAFYYCEEFDKAIDAFIGVKKMAPGDIHTRYSLGLLYLNQNDKIRAIQEYRELKKLDEHKADDLFDYIYPEDQGMALESAGLLDDDGEENITLKQSMEQEAQQEKEQGQDNPQETSGQRRRVRTPSQPHTKQRKPIQAKPVRKKPTANAKATANNKKKTSEDAQ